MSDRPSGYDVRASTVVLDLATFPEPCFAVIHQGQLLPMRFAQAAQGYEHLQMMVTGKPKIDPLDEAVEKRMKQRVAA